MLLLCQLSLDCLFAKFQTLQGFVSHNTPSPLTESVGGIIVLFAVYVHQVFKFRLVALVNGGDGNTSSILLVDKGSKTRLVFHDAVRNIHLSAQSWHPDNQFDRVDVVSDDNKLGFLFFNKGGDVVQPELDNIRSSFVRYFFPSSFL